MLLSLTLYKNPSLKILRAVMKHWQALCLVSAFSLTMVITTREEIRFIHFVLGAVLVSIYSRPLVNISWMNKQVVLVLCKGLCEQRVKIMYINVFFPLLVGLAGALGGWCHLAVAVLHDPLCHHGSLATICKQPEVWGFFLFTLLTIEWPRYRLGWFSGWHCQGHIM